MERPQKRPRLGLAPHDESDDDDELIYEPEEISQRRDPGARLARSRATAAFGLKSAFESIFERYERDFEGVADEIDLRTADIVVDNRHLQRMRNERDMGNTAKETEEIPAPDNGVAGREVGGAGYRSASGGDEDEDQILQGKSSALVRKAPGALGPRMSSVLGHQSGISSQLGGTAQLPPLGASPLFFGSWGPPGAMDPAWQAPQLQVPQFKSSFAADLFTGRYQLPAREASKSIWAPGSHSDDEEDTPVEKPRMRLAPPTRRVPARPKAMKLIRAPPTNPDNSDDEECILMGVNASQVPNADRRLPSNQQEPLVSADEADLLLEKLEKELDDGHGAERGEGEMSSASGRPATGAEESLSIASPGELTWQTTGSPSNPIHSSSPKGKKISPFSKKKKKRISTPRMPLTLGDESLANMVVSPARSNLPANHSTCQATTKRQESVVVELPPICVLDDGSYLDFSDMADLSTEIPLPAPIDNQSSTPREAQHSQTGEKRKDEQIPLSDRTIPDSQHPPVSLPASSASNAPSKQTPENLQWDKQPGKKMKPSVYDFSDEEVGFLAKPPRKRKRISDITRFPAVSERTPMDATTGNDAEAQADRNQPAGSGLSSASKHITAWNAQVTMFSPLKTRSARKRAHPSGASPHESSSLSVDFRDSARRISRKRRLTPTSLNSADDTEGEAALVQAPEDPSLPVALVSPPPEAEPTGITATAEGQNHAKAGAPESVAGAVAVPNDDLPLQRTTRSSRGRITRGQAEEAAGRTAPSSELAPISYTRPVPGALSPPDHQLRGESQDTINSTPHREQHAQLAVAGPSSLQTQPATPSKLRLSLPGTPNSVPSTGHRSLTSLIPEESPDTDSEDELTSSSLWSLFQKPTPTQTTNAKGARRRRGPEGTPTESKGRHSAVRLSSTLSVERPSAPNESVMRTPGGTIRKCGERGLKCGKDFCFTCC